MVRSVKRIFVCIHLGRRSARQEECVFGGRVQMKHGRICLLTNRSSVLSTSASIVLVFITAIAPSLVSSTIPRIVGRRSILQRGRGRKVEIQEFIGLLTAVAALMLLTLFRVATHTDFQNLCTLNFVYSKFQRWRWFAPYLAVFLLKISTLFLPNPGTRLSGSVDNA